MQEKQKIILTGGRGVIGSILEAGLKKEYQIVSLDRKDDVDDDHFIVDISSEYGQLLKYCIGASAIIHLAWDFSEDYPGDTVIAGNKTMAENIYRVAVEAGIAKLVVASSVHVDEYETTAQKIHTTLTMPLPDSAYGASKVYIENLGRYYATHKGLDVTCLRFGGVNLNDSVRFEEDPHYDKVLLYKEDCVSAVQSVLHTPTTPSTFSTFYVVSNNPGKIHDTQNRFGWFPKKP